MLMSKSKNVLDICIYECGIELLHFVVCKGDEREGVPSHVHFCYVATATVTTN